MSSATPNSTPEPNYLTVAEVAKRSGKSEPAVRQLCRAGKLPGARQANDRAPWQIPPSALDAYLRNNPPASFWQRLRTTKLWQRVAATVGVISLVLGIVNTTTGFFSNWFGAAPMVEIACQLPLIGRLCPRTPLPVRLAAQGETLIVIATFHGEIANRDEPQMMIKEGIDKEIAKLRAENRLGKLNLRVAIHPQVLTGGEEAQPAVIDFAKPYSASIVIWGDVTGTRVRVNFLNLRHPDFDAAHPAPIEEKTRTPVAAVANPQAYSNFINKDLPGMMSFLTLFAVGQSYLVNQEYATAAQIIKQGIAALPEGTKIEGLAEAYFHLGWLYQLPLGDLATAIRDYDQAIQLNPKLATSYGNRGNARQAHGDLTGAIQDYNQAIQLDPKYANAYAARGFANRTLGKLEKALADFKSFLALAPIDHSMRSQIEQWITEIEAELAKKK